jgi:hypothetical protein
MTPAEIERLEKYFKKTFKMDEIEIRQRHKKDDSVEVFVEDEFVGVIYKDEEDGELTYQFQMAILAYDLDS